MQRTTIIYSNTVIGTLAVDGWAVTFGPAQSPPRCTICNSSPINGQCTNVLVLALDLEGVHDVKLHHPSSSVATSNQ